jgi:hypothetical protein
MAALSRIRSRSERPPPELRYVPVDDVPSWYSPYAPLGVSEQESQGLLADHRSVTAGYLRAMGTTLLAGRFFEERDEDSQRPVMIVDDLLAGKQWPGEGAVGKRIRHELYDNGRLLPREAEVVGVIRHVRHHGLHVQGREQISIPYSQSARPHLTFTIRTARDRLTTVLAGLFGGLAPVLALVGIFGVVSYSVGQRAPEIIRAPRTGAAGPPPPRPCPPRR